MSSRRMAKVAKKEAASNPTTTPSWRSLPEFTVDEEENKTSEEREVLLTRMVLNSHKNYRCPKCEGQEHQTDIDRFGATTFICSSCGEKVEIVSPYFFGETHEHIMGHSVIEFTGNPDDPLKMHLLTGSSKQ
jgi:ribosomal protein L37AE/L43A